MTNSARSTRTLYFVRTLFQMIWACLVITTSEYPQLAAFLLTAYPLWDVACTLYDLKAPDNLGSAKTMQIINVVLGLATALAIALTVSAQPEYSIAAFGAWALGAGLLQLTVGLSRRKQLGGQWAMILSGAQSIAAGAAFALGGLNGKVHIKDVAGYAVFGAIYFMIAGILLSRRLSPTSPTNGGAPIAS